MAFFRDAWAIVRMEWTLFTRFPKLKVSAIGVMVIPALYALIYLASVRDPSAHTDQLRAAIVNLDQGLDYRGQQVNIGKDVVASLEQKRSFGFVQMASADEARAAVRQGHMAFALIIPKDFSANAVPGNEAAGGRLGMVVSEGNNYNSANLVKRFAAELGHQVNINLNEKRWSLVLSTAAGSVDKVAQLRKGVSALQEGAHKIDTGLAKAETGAQTLSTGAQTFSSAVGQLADGVKQMGAGLRTMDQQRPSAQDLTALKTGANDLVTGHATLGNGLQELQGGATKLAEGGARLRDETKTIPLVGTKISEGAGQLTTGAQQLATGLQSARNGQEKLADGAQKLNTGVGKLTDGMAALGTGIHTMASKAPADTKLDELAAGGNSLAQGVSDLRGGLGQLHSGSRELAAGIDLLQNSLPADMAAPDGSARGLADSVEPAIEVIAPVPNNGAGFAPNFLGTSLWLGAVMSAFLVHLRRLPLAAGPASAPAKLVGKMGILGVIVSVQSMAIMAMAILVLGLPVAYPAAFAGSLVLTSLTFLTIIVALTRAFGDAGKAAALLLMVLQLSSAGGVMPVELAGGIYQTVSPWLPFTWVVKALRASMFGAFDADWWSAWQMLASIAAVAALSACFVGRWKLVPPEEHRPAMDI